MKEPQFYAFYFSGHWCAPCRRFTPTLVTFYNKMRERGYNNFELIFVSSDLSSSKMRGYMKEAKMPWPAIRYTKTENKLIQKYSGRGIPCLVVTDHEGNILLHSYKGEEYVGPRTVLKEFYPILEWSNKIQESEAHVSL